MVEMLVTTSYVSFSMKPVKESPPPRYARLLNGSERDPSIGRSLPNETACERGIKSSWRNFMVSAVNYLRPGPIAMPFEPKLRNFCM